MDETELIRAIQSGDQKAFRLLVEKYQRVVVNTCFGIVHNQTDAEDIGQDVFLEVFRSAVRFRGDAQLSTWLYRIATNRSLNFVRKNREITENHSDQPDQKLTNQQRSEVLHQAIDRLPEKQRIAFVLNKYEDLTYQQIAEVMETSLPSVESLLHRAKKSLQEQLYECYRKKCI
jgi:RNA polymerase sigma-70 factor (ECF subfamily)